jgi:hypothetical protein
MAILRWESRKHEASRSLMCEKHHPFKKESIKGIEEWDVE